MPGERRYGKAPSGVTLELLVRAADARLRGVSVEDWARAEGWSSNVPLVGGILHDLPPDLTLRRWARLSHDKRRLIIMRILDPRGGERRQLANSTTADE